MPRKLVCAVDVGTRSARAGIFDTAGALLGRGDHPVMLYEPAPGRAEHSSEDIWRAVCAAVRQARQAADVAADEIAGIAFDATCSLVVRGRDGSPLPVGEDRDTVAWLDHRALAEAAECTASGHPLLKFVGGTMSPEMQIPKAMWLKRHLPEIWDRTGLLFDLADFLAWRACGSAARSLCTATSKWTFLAHEEPGWRRDFLDGIGLPDLAEKAGLPAQPSPVGADLGALGREAAQELGLSQNCRVAAGMVDAFAGALGVFGWRALDPEAAAGRAVLVAGTSSCVMTMTREPVAIDGFWGPYFGPTLQDIWMTEGGQSATGALLDHIVRVYGAGGEPMVGRHRAIAARIAELRAVEGENFAARLHVLPDFHGNRSPLADPAALGVISGLSLDASFDGLCRLYFRACVGIALGVRQIVETMRAAGHAVDTLHVTGGHTKNPLLMELYADATGCRLVEPVPDEGVLLGTAMAAATGAGLFAGLEKAAMAMRQQERERLPDLSTRTAYDRDYRIFLELQRQRKAIGEME
ncbi:FGGY-family carbohydrate kinase [Mesorhizobium sp. LHD-90]|uniref:FGGY-family carbohydrate kinase n=1 Tax=Mesorhizobium sp. LHD-90 TaxID=3071414 RepID=UPI0027E1F6E0|nr:FGGY-family carbohydrate kinase [Mesorhizobium sp. LHD-90]MDQ6435840.1 FGGY-family carbohydrate kinase [Mesorhizobium sp. LHD-90]